MTATKTAALPHDHPLAQLLERSQRANKLPSCEGCKHGSLVDHFVSPDGYAIKHAALDCRRGWSESVSPFNVQTLHFCAAWEPKA